MDKPGRWRNRIVGEDEVLGDQLLASPKNWRIHPKHQQDALSGVLAEVGWVQRVIVNQRSGHVVDGHLRAALAISNGSLVPVTYVDLSEEEEALILATFDPLGALAGTDAAAFDVLVRAVEPADAALAALLGDLGTAADESLLRDRSAGEHADRRNALGQAEVVKVAVAVADLGVVEQAIRLTAEANRGSALTVICRSYLEAHPEAGQFDLLTQGDAAPGLAARVRSPGHP